MAEGIVSSFIRMGQESALKDWAAKQYGQSNPGLASLAAADPEMFKSVLPDIIKHEQEGKAIADYYGASSRPQQQPAIPEGVPQNADSVLARMAQSEQQPQQNDNALRKYQAMAYLPSALQSVAAQQMMFENPTAGGGVNTNGSTPEEIMKSLNPNVAATVKSMLEGRQAPPSSFAQKSPYWQQMMAIANQVDPEFDQTAWKQRVDTTNDMISTKGKSRQSINSAEMAINHLVHLQEQNKKLGGWGVLNEAVRNPIMTATNDPRIGPYNNTAKNAADEISKVMTGTSGGTGEDRATRFKQLSADAGSPEVREATIQNQIDLIMGKLEPMADSYNKAMGKSIKPLELLSPATQAAFKKLRGEDAPFVDPSGNYKAQDRGPGAILEKSTANVSPTSSPAVSKDAYIAELKRRGMMK